MNFCKANNVTVKCSTFASIITEELLNNIITYGTKSEELCNSYVRVTLKKDLNIRIYDDNDSFDPRKEMEKIISEPVQPDKEVFGLRLVKNITDKNGAFDYQNTAGINTSIINLRNED